MNRELLESLCRIGWVVVIVTALLFIPLRVLEIAEGAWPVY